MHIISIGWRADNKFMLISLNQQFPTENNSRPKFSRSTSGNSHAVPSVHLTHCACMDRYKHPTLVPFSPLSSCFFWLSEVCTECWKPLSALFIQLPAGCRGAFVSGSEFTNADTEIICPVKNSLTRLICGRSHQRLPCRALQRRTGIISQPIVCSPPRRKLSEFPRMPNPVFLAWLGPLAAPTIPLRQGPAWRDIRGWGGLWGRRTAPSFSTPWSWQPCSQHSAPY